MVPARSLSGATGAIMTSGGAWNASIVAEIVSWGSTTLTARGLGAYIAEATSKGDWPRIVLGVSLMSLFVAALNKFVLPLFGPTSPRTNTDLHELMAEQRVNISNRIELAVQIEVLAAEGVANTFPVPGGELSVLEDVSLRVQSGEVVALLGRSGSGKSTLLRILAGLISASRGKVLLREGIAWSKSGSRHGFPELCPTALADSPGECGTGLVCARLHKSGGRGASRACFADGALEGFEGAYPRELSGGMKQRVGFARAFVMKPDVLMMDEPFSALDVLTAENLRGEISDLWEAGKFPARSILFVTHNIEEAVLLSDRVGF